MPRPVAFIEKYIPENAIYYILISTFGNIHKMIDELELCSCLVGQVHDLFRRNSAFGLWTLAFETHSKDLLYVSSIKYCDAVDERIMNMFDT